MSFIILQYYEIIFNQFSEIRYYTDLFKIKNYN